MSEPANQRRKAESGMQGWDDDRRRLLLREGRGLLTYLLGEPPPEILMRRYVRAVESLRDGRPVAIPAILLDWPNCIAVLDDQTLLHRAGAEELSWRLTAALQLAEFSTAGARRFLLIGEPSGAVKSTAALTAIGLCEGFWRLVRLFTSPLLRRALKARE